MAALTVNFSAGMPTNGLVSWWRGEGNPDDFMGANNGVLMGGLSDEANGIIGRGFDFNGSDGFLSVPTFPNLGMSSFSFSLWYRATVSSAGQLIELINKGWTVVGTPANAGFQLRLQYGTLDFGVMDETGAQNEYDTAAPEPGINLWHHAAMTLDRSASRMALYVDGSLAAQTNFSGLGSLDTNIRMAFGALDRTPWGPIVEFFQGQMDEMMYFNRPLGAEEIESLYAAQGGQPRLDAQSSAGQALLSWSSACDGYALESCTNLSVNTWQTVTNGPCLAGCRLQVSLPANTPSQCFFRLHKPGR
ncbi:MAG TPA: LamG domain-containing protein [Candidatus Acidoferrum sp.]|nr:LamG domain-containing protein [Candidatus Acidoferrum sp.]